MRPQIFPWRLSGSGPGGRLPPGNPSSDFQPFARLSGETALEPDLEQLYSVTLFSGIWRKLRPVWLTQFLSLIGPPRVNGVRRTDVIKLPEWVADSLFSLGYAGLHPEISATPEEPILATCADTSSASPPRPAITALSTRIHVIPFAHTSSPGGDSLLLSRPSPGLAPILLLVLCARKSASVGCRALDCRRWTRRESPRGCRPEFHSGSLPSARWGVGESRPRRWIERGHRRGLDADRSVRTESRDASHFRLGRRKCVCL